MLSFSLGVLLKYKRIIQNENRKRIFVKKRKILINTARSTTLENCYLWKENWEGGLEHGHPPKKRPPPPALMINYITCRCLFACLVFLAVLLVSVLLPYLLAVLVFGCVLYLPWCLTALLITYYNTSNNPFNTLIIAYITFDSILFQYSN